MMSVQNENATLLNVTALEAVVCCGGCLKDQWMFTTVVLSRFLSLAHQHGFCIWFATGLWTSSKEQELENCQLYAFVLPVL